MILNIILVIMSVVAPVMGVNYIRKENKHTVAQYCMLINSIATFMWCFGYGAMGFSTEAHSALLWRCLALSGVYVFVINELVLVNFITKMRSRLITVFTIIIAVFGMIAYGLVMQPNVVNFSIYNGRMAYTSNASIGRILQFVFTVIIIAAMMYMAIHRYRTFKYRRDKNIVLLMILAHCCMIVGTMLDVVLPLMGIPSFPGSAFGGFICYIFNLIALEQLSFFELSSSGMSNFIAHNVESSVLFFDNEDRLIMANEFAYGFLGIPNNANPFFSELFEITPKEAKALLLNNFSSKGKTELRLNARNSGRVCSVILTPIVDNNGDPMYTACLVYDLTKEVEMYNEVEALKNQLQEDLQQKTQELQMFTFQTIGAITNIIEAKDVYTRGHSERVANYSSKLAKALGMSDEEIQNIHNIASLHDIGKIGVHDSVLNKPGKLTDEEYAEVKEHTVVGSKILSELSLIPHLGDGARYHHEWYNGKGYPEGLKGEEIPYVARIICIADSFDAMNSKRVYRDSLSQEKIIAELEKGAGTQFDPELVPVFINLYESGELFR